MKENSDLYRVVFYDSVKRETMKESALLFCSLLFVGGLFVADMTNVKLISYSLLGLDFLAPAGTLAFAVTFLATDVICEITRSRKLAIKVIFIALFLRILALSYYHLVVGDENGDIPLVHLSALWTPEKQQHLKFMLDANVRVALSGLCSASISFVLDSYVFNRLREKWANKNLYWFRNGLTTTLAQIVNSTIFISIAFGNVLSPQQIALTTIGQICLKITFAWADTPLALILRNYGQGRKFWYAFWKKDFFLG